MGTNGPQFDVRVAVAAGRAYHLLTPVMGLINDKKEEHLHPASHWPRDQVLSVSAPAVVPQHVLDPLNRRGKGLLHLGDGMPDREREEGVRQRAMDA